MDGKWGAPNTTGWEIGDYLIFDLPMNDIVRCPNGTGNLNNVMVHVKYLTMVK